MAAFSKLLLESVDNDIRRSRLKLAEKYFDYEATTASQKELPKLRAYMDVVGKDASLSHDEKIERVHTILFALDRSTSGVKGPDKSNKKN